MDASGRRAVRHVDAGLETVVLVCRKCSKKVGGGFGDDGRVPLAKALLRHLKGRHNGKTKALKARTAVIEVGCMDLCPRKAVVVLRADRPGDWVVVPEGTATAEVIDHLALTVAGAGSR